PSPAEAMLLAMGAGDRSALPEWLDRAAAA
ncbi:HNH endonuclease, partial [Streptomyces sp. SID8455]|nr:HNH endonuclease [Streptomyces sp. SID8455]